MTKLYCMLLIYCMAIVPVTGWTQSTSQLNTSGFSDLSTWEQKGDANWKMANGGMTANAGSGYLISPAEYADFEITLEFYPEDDTNGGVYFRCMEEGVVNAHSCYEANIFDHRPTGDGKTGSIPGVSEPLHAMEAEGKWNTYVISAIGPHLVIQLNGVETVNTMHSRNTKGHIALQFSSGGSGQFSTGGITFRNVRIRNLNTN